MSIVFLKNVIKNNKNERKYDILRALSAKIDQNYLLLVYFLLQLYCVHV